MINSAACGQAGGPRSQKTSRLLQSGHPALRSCVYRPNRYPASCAICGHRVPALAGCLDKDTKTGRWEVLC